MTKPRSMQEHRGWAWCLVIAVLRPLLVLFTRQRWIDGEKIPAQGGVVLAANHVSHLDPLTFAHLVHDYGRLPRFLAKAALFDIAVVRRVLRASGQIPVLRLTPDAARAFSAAVEAVRAGRLVVVYPEGTLTRQPELWPMTGRTGAAHIGLASGVPVIPVAQWGAQRILPPYTRLPRLLPRKLVEAKVGDPVDLDDLRGKEITPEVLREATERIMDAITTLLEELRGESAPPERFDPRRAGVRLTGNPHARARQQPFRRKSR